MAVDTELNSPPPSPTAPAPAVPPPSPQPIDPCKIASCTFEVFFGGVHDADDIEQLRGADMSKISSISG